MDIIRITHWRVYESADGRRFALGRVGTSIEGPVPFDAAILIGPPGGDDMVPYYKETGWNVDRHARDVTTEVWESDKH